jgi:hypothetical protein
MTGDLGAAGLAVLLFGIVMVSLYLVVRAGVRAGMEDAWRQAGWPPPTPPVPEQRTAEETGSAENESVQASASDHQSAV